MSHPAIAKDNVAVITGGASGIGFAAAAAFARTGMKVCIADVDQGRLAEAATKLSSAAGASNVMTSAVDVGKADGVMELERAVRARFGGTDILMNNAGIQPGSTLFAEPDNWQRIIDVNMWGIINGSRIFAPNMIARGKPGVIINTGSKQGITCPPGDTAYNVSKAGVKVLTEGLAHSLRNAEGGHISAHLLIPGSTFTGMTSRGRTEKPVGAWWPDQVVDMLIESMGRGDFYILCPDNDVTRDIDNRRITWAAQDITENRPALSRWHPDYSEAFARFLAGN